MRSADNFTALGKLKKIDWEAQDTPVHWWYGEPVLTYLANIYIIITAIVERFTVKVAMSLKDKIKDDQLRLEWEIFTKEEMAHAYQHTCVSNHLKRHKYPVNFLTKYARLAFWFASKTLSFKSKIALVLAMEFYAHLLSVAVLENNVIPIDKLAIFDFLRWHAKEELSHVNLCLKVYEYFKGGYSRRLILLVWFSLFVFFTIICFSSIFFFVDIYQGRKIKLKNFSTAFIYILGSKGLLWGRIKTFLSYFHPQFKLSCSMHALQSKNYSSKVMNGDDTMDNEWGKDG